MSRYTPNHNTTGLLGAAQHWQAQCLLGDGSLFGDSVLWSSEHLSELNRYFIQNPLEGDESFVEKLSLQLADAPPEAVQLMAELHWLLLLFSTNIKPETKRDLIGKIWALSGELLPESPLLSDSVLAGAGSTGTAYNTHRWRELVFLIELLQAFKALDDDARQALLVSPWEFAGWLDTQPGAEVRQLRHILCFLLFPDSFEHTSVGRDKKAIVGAIAKLSKAKLKQMSLTEVDQTLLALRQSLEQKEGGAIDFYTSPWVDQWKPSPNTWLMAWNPSNWTWDSFQNDRLRIARGEIVTLQWRTASTQPKEGDSFFLVRCGQEPRGLIGRGNVVSEPYEDEHYKSEQAAQGEKVRYVDITFTDLRDPKADSFLSLADLAKGNVDGQQWTPQQSGIEIKPMSAKVVTGLWNKLPPVQTHTPAVKQTPVQKAINIAKPVNQIFYGPPGTGKTHHWRTHLQPKYESAASQVSTGEWLEQQLGSTSWWETAALVVADLTEKGHGTTVNDLLIHPYFKAKARVQGRADSPHLRATCWNAFQVHAVQESETVNLVMEKRQPPLIFDKKSGGHWVLTGDWDEAGEGLREQLKKLQLGPQSQDARIKRHLSVTFHQSYSYEDFVEGIRPQTTEGGISYEVRDGLFKSFCKRARQDPNQRYALFIDEINRGNIARIFGELITLIEADKRAWWDEEGQLVDGIELTLPYSGDRFGVPKNLDIYATMNTADRSIALMDAALRRRFRFSELMPEPNKITGSQGDGFIPDSEGGLLSLRALLNAINLRLRYLLHRDQTFGHAYLMGVKDLDELRQVIVFDMIPMLAEYFYDDWSQIRRVLADEGAPVEQQIITVSVLDPMKLFPDSEMELPERPDYRVKAPAAISADAIRKIYESLDAEA